MRVAPSASCVERVHAAGRLGLCGAAGGQAAPACRGLVAKQMASSGLAISSLCWPVGDPGWVDSCTPCWPSSTPNQQSRLVGCDPDPWKRGVSLRWAQLNTLSSAPTLSQHPPPPQCPSGCSSHCPASHRWHGPCIPTNWSLHPGLQLGPSVLCSAAEDGWPWVGVSDPRLALGGCV